MSNSSHIQHQPAFASTEAAPGVLGVERQMPDSREGSDSGIRHQQLAAESLGLNVQVTASARQRSRAAQQLQSSEGTLPLPEAASDSVRWQDSQRQSSSLAEFSASDMQQVCSLIRSDQAISWVLDDLGNATIAR